MLHSSVDALLKNNQETDGGPNSVSCMFVGTGSIVVKAATLDATKQYDVPSGRGTVLDTPTY